MTTQPEFGELFIGTRKGDVNDMTNALTWCRRVTYPKDLDSDGLEKLRQVCATPPAMGPHNARVSTFLRSGEVKAIVKCKQFSMEHCADAPARVYYDADGKVTRMEWYLEGHRHRVGAPARTSLVDNDEAWYFQGLFHRLNGPACITTRCDGELHETYMVGNYRIGGHVVNKNTDFDMTKYHDKVLDYCISRPNCPTVLHLLQEDTPDYILQYCDQHPASRLSDVLRRVRGRSIKAAR